MVFSSAIFCFLFLPICVIIYYLIDRHFRNLFLLIVSLLFYAWGEPRFVFVMMGAVLVNWCAALIIHRFKKSGATHLSKFALILDVFFNLGLFFVFKYLNFTILNINSVAALFGVRSDIIPQTHIALPIGISFFTFQAMSYVFDVYYGRGEIQKNPLNVALYISLFPQLIAGPIVRYQTVADEIRVRRETLEDVSIGVRRFIIGLAKKTIIANTIAVAADAAFSALTNGKLTMGYAWLGALAYSLQIYFDFSGYSDMAIGLGLMFGFHFLENFEHPYMSATITEFWRRWHISLSSWFRDYVYIPLGGSRVKTGRMVFNLFAVWALTGIWHGANWTFIIWGLMYFVLLTIEKVSGLNQYLKNHNVSAGFYRFFTLIVVMCGWVIFRAENLRQGLQFIGAMFGFAPNGIWSPLTSSIWSEYIFLILVAIVCSIEWKRIFPINNKPFCSEGFFAVPMFIGKLIAYGGLAIIAISFTVASTYNPFIYFNF